MNKIITLIALLLLMASSCDDCQSPDYIFVQACDDISDMPQPEEDMIRLVRIIKLIPNPQEGPQELVIKNFSEETYNLFDFGISVEDDFNDINITEVSTLLDSAAILKPCDSLRIILDNFNMERLSGTYDLMYFPYDHDHDSKMQLIKYSSAAIDEEINY